MLLFSKETDLSLNTFAVVSSPIREAVLFVLALEQDVYSSQTKGRGEERRSGKVELLLMFISSDRKPRFSRDAT